MRALGWILTALIVGGVASTRKSGPREGEPCPPALAEKANRLLVRADAEIASAPGTKAADPVDLAELEAVAAQIDACLPHTPNRPTVSPADELRARVALLRVRRAATPGGGSPLPPVAADEGASSLDAIAADVGKQIEASQKVSPGDPAARQLLDRMMQTLPKLEAAGLRPESERLRRAAQELLSRLAGVAPAPPPAPPPEGERPAPGSLPAELAAQAEAVLNVPGTEPASADLLADRILTTFREGSFSDVVAKLRKRAEDLRAVRPPPSSADAIQLLRLADDNPAFASPATLEAAGRAVAASDARAAQALMTKAAEIRRARGIRS